MRRLNRRSFKTRDRILFGEEVDWKKSIGGIRGFKGLTIEQLEELEKARFLDTSDRQNDAPSIKEFVMFMRKYPRFTAHGYATSPHRKDYRVSLEGLELRGEYDAGTKADFLELCRKANDLIIEGNRLYCWYD